MKLKSNLFFGFFFFIYKESAFILNDNAFDRDDPIIYSMIGDIIAFNSIKYAKIY